MELGLHIKIPFFFLLLVQKKETKKKTPRKPTTSFRFTHKNLTHIATKLVVRTFRGQQPHPIRNLILHRN